MTLSEKDEEKKVVSEFSRHGTFCVILFYMPGFKVAVN